MVPSMSAVAWYGTIAGILLPLTFLALRRLEWPAGTVNRLGTAAGVALVWPLALCVLSFGFVVIARLIQARIHNTPRKTVITPVAPAA